MRMVLNSRKLYEYSFIIILGCLILAWGFLILLQGPNSTQRGIFFANMNDFWADRTNVVGYSSLRDPYHNTMYTGLSEKGYPPLVYVFMYLLSRLVHMQPYYDANYFKGMYTEPLFLIVVVLLISFAYIIGFELIKEIKKGALPIRYLTAAVLLLSGPMLYTLERGNIILWVPFLCLAFVFFHNSENKFLKEVSLICLAIAAGIKLTPAILGLLLIYERRWKEAIRTIIYGIIAFFVPFLFFKGGLHNIPLMFQNLGSLMKSYANSEGCAIRNIFRTGEAIFHLSPTPMGLIRSVTGIAFGGLIICSYFTTNDWERVTALSLIFTVLPNYAAYYNLIYLIPAAVSFLNSENHQYTDLIILISLILLFNPLQTPIVRLGIDYHFGVFLLLTIIVFRGFRYGWKQLFSRKGE